MMDLTASERDDWPLIEFVADALIEKRVLSYDEVVALVAQFDREQRRAA